MDEILQFMQQHNTPMTRKSYLDLAYLGNPPKVLDAEAEYSLPEEFQLEPAEEFE